MDWLPLFALSWLLYYFSRAWLRVRREQEEAQRAINDARVSEPPVHVGGICFRGCAACGWKRCSYCGGEYMGLRSCPNCGAPREASC